jgi:hypothetical protein
VDARHHGRQIVEHQVRLYPQDAIPSAPQPLIAAPIGPTPPGVIPTIHLHHQARGGSHEIGYVSSEGHLPMEAHSELFGADSCKEPLFGLKSCPKMGWR